MQSQFVDYVKIYFTSGKGGNGVVSWRREKHVPKGGPDGGDGGVGGSIILRGNSQLWTLLDLKYRKFIKAEPGNNGEGRLKSGKNGKDEVLDVPLGTVVKDGETEEFITEILEHGQEFVFIPGGRGGKGNAHFKSPTNQAPDFSQQGEEGSERSAILELKVLADVGLVGFPNAGKSTLLSVLTAAKPKIASYPFTTLEPNLGIVKYKGFTSFVMADIPGIIEGAHEGKGLGTTFLRHIERNSILLFMVPADTEDPAAEFKILSKELELYNPELKTKDRLYAISKTDLAEPETLTKWKKKLKKYDPVFFSSAVGEGLEELQDRIWDLLHRETNAEPATAPS